MAVYTIAITREKLTKERATVEVKAGDRRQAEQIALKTRADWIVLEEKYSEPEV